MCQGSTTRAAPTSPPIGALPCCDAWATNTSATRCGTRDRQSSAASHGGRIRILPRRRAPGRMPGTFRMASARVATSARRAPGDQQTRSRSTCASGTHATRGTCRCMAWLYVPGLAASKSESGACFESTAPSVTSSGKPIRPPSWRRAWRKGGWHQLLSGTTLRPSTADAGVDRWIASLRDSRVNPSAKQGSDRPTTTAGISGRMCGGLSTGRDRISSFWRTSGLLFQLDNGTGDRPTWWSETSWSDWVTALRKRSSVHRMLVRRTSESASLSWDTPNNSDAPRPLHTQASQTPKVATGAYSYSNGDKTRPFLNLEGQAEAFHAMASAWPTPTTSDWKDTGENMNWEKRAAKSRLPGVVNVALVPRSRPSGRRDQATRGSGHRSSATMQDSRPHSMQRRLSATFVEWLMGWPRGWSIARIASEHSATALCPPKQNMRSGCALNNSAGINDGA